MEIRTGNIAEQGMEIIQSPLGAISEEGYPQELKLPSEIEEEEMSKALKAGEQWNGEKKETVKEKVAVKKTIVDKVETMEGELDKLKKANDLLTTSLVEYRNNVSIKELQSYYKIQILESVISKYTDELTFGTILKEYHAIIDSKKDDRILSL